MLPSAPDFLSAFFACLYAGALAVPLFPPSNEKSLERIASIARDAGARFLLTNAAAAERIHRLGGLLGGTDEIEIDVADLPRLPNRLAGPPRGEDPAFLQYTSGSTSAPRGVMVTHDNLKANARNIDRWLKVSNSDRAVSWLPLFHDMGLLGGVVQPVFTGVPIYLMPPVAFARRPVRWLQAISRYRATVSGGPSSAFDRCVRCVSDEQREGLDLSSWRIAYNGAEPVAARTLDEFADAFAASGFRRQAFCPCYGLAEATLFVSGTAPERAPTVLWLDAAELRQHRVRITPPHTHGAYRVVASGRPREPVEVQIVDGECGEECAAGEVGEVCVAGPNVTAGYWRPTCTSAAETDPDAKAGYWPPTCTPSVGSGRFRPTGDLGFVLRGELFITGRKKDLIIFHGRNIYPQDIERAAVFSHPLLNGMRSAAFSIRTANQELLIVLQEVEPRRLRQPGVLVKAIRRAVTEEHGIAPGEVVLVRSRSLPTTSSGKIQRGRCKEKYENGTLARLHSGRLTEATA